jgi:hypothetical protein
MTVAGGIAPLDHVSFDGTFGLNLRFGTPPSVVLGRVGASNCPWFFSCLFVI